MEVHNNRPVALGSNPRQQQPKQAARLQQPSPASGTELRREISGQLAQQILQESGIKPTEIFRYKVQLDIDGDTGRVVAEVREKDSGELVKEVPSRTLLRQAAMLNEALGMILDKPV